MLEIIAVISTLLCVFLTARNNALCWPVSIVGILSYFMIFRINGDISNMLLQLIFLWLSIVGWYNWKSEDSRLITNLSVKNLVLSVLSVLILITFLLSVNYFFGGNFIYLDAITSGVSMMAIYLTSKRKIEAWFYWMAADFFYIMFFYQNKLYASLILYLILFLITFYGYKNWINKKSYDRKFNT